MKWLMVWAAGFVAFLVIVGIADPSPRWPAAAAYVVGAISQQIAVLIMLKDRGK